MSSIARVIQVSARATATVWLLAIAGWATAQEPTPLPKYTGDRVYVKDVPDHYQSVAQTIKELERTSPQTYFVVVVKSAGAGEHATRDYLDRLYDSWRRDADAAKLKLDPQRSVIVLTALDNRQVAVHPGALLRDRYGLKSTTIDGEIVRKVFVPLARENKYPEALSALLTKTNDFLVAQGDTETKATAAANPATRDGSFALPPPSPAAPAPVAQPVHNNPVASTTTAPAAPARTSTTGRDLTLSLLASLVALGLMVAGLVWLARRRRRGSFDAKLKEYRTKAVAMMDRLDTLKARLKGLTIEDPDFQEPMTGRTLAQFEKVQADLGKLWDRWLEVMDVVDTAQRKAERGSSKLSEADQLVSDAKVFAEVEAGATACSVAMDQLNAAHEEARKTAESVVEGRSKAVAKVADVGKAGLPTAPYTPDIDRLNALETQAEAILVPDPMGARDVLDESLAAATMLHDRAGNILDRLEGGKQVQATIEALRSDVADHRRKGLKLTEEGGDPDHQIARSEQELAELQAALEAGDPEAAAVKLEAGRKSTNEARATLDAVLKARALCAREQPERERETRRLREAITQYEAFENELKREYAPSSWQVVAGNLTQARALLETFDGKAREAAQVADGSSQKYLLGARLIGQLAQEQNAVFRLMNAVGERLSGLKSLREDARKLADNLEDRARIANAFFSQYDHVVGAQARASLKAAAGAKEQVAQITTGNRPDWPTIRQQLGKAVEEYSIAQSQAEADLKIYELLTSEYDEARRNASRVEAFLAGHGEDRMAANQRYRNAEEVLKRVGDESTRVGNEWARLLDQVRGARADLDHSEQLAREDVRLARQAESEIADAVRTIRQARTYFSMGVTLNTSGAESLLSQAQRHYHSQNYEQAVQSAGAAVQQVRQAHNQAVQQDYLRQMQLQAEQRRGAAELNSFGMGAAAGAASSIYQQAVSEHDAGDGVVSGDRSPPPPEATRSDSSSTSWASETSETNW